MPESRRDFLTTLAAAPALQPPAPVQVPKMKFGGAEISRLICGENQFYGYSHFNALLSRAMSDYYTPARVCEVLHRCTRVGINTLCFHSRHRGSDDFRRFQAEGGKMHLIMQGLPEADDAVKEFKPLGVYYQGEAVDRAFRAGKMADIREWCKRMRDSGSMVGVGTHKPEVIAFVEEQGWDVDFYAGCVYNRTRSAEEWAKALHGESVEMQGECYLKSDPPRMYKVMRQTKKPCFAFKILAAGRVSNVDEAFRVAYASLKPIDGVFVGMFPLIKDEVLENAQRVQRLLAAS